MESGRLGFSDGSGVRSDSLKDSANISSTA